MPSQGRHREVTSTSNCTTFQARRLGIREKVPGGDGTRRVATLNGTLATSTLVPILENHRAARRLGPAAEAQRPSFGGLELLEPVGR